MGEGGAFSLNQKKESGTENSNVSKCYFQTEEKPLTIVLSNELVGQ